MLDWQPAWLNKCKRLNRPRPSKRLPFKPNNEHSKQRFNRLPSKRQHRHRPWLNSKHSNEHNRHRQHNRPLRLEHNRLHNSSNLLLLRCHNQFRFRHQYLVIQHHQLRFRHQYTVFPHQHQITYQSQTVKQFHLHR